MSQEWLVTVLGVWFLSDAVPTTLRARWSLWRKVLAWCVIAFFAACIPAVWLLD